MELTVEEENNKWEEHLNAETVGVENTLQTDAAVIPNGNSISNDSFPNLNSNLMEKNINSGVFLPKTVSSAELFDIQIREIDEALFKFGQHTDEKVNAMEAINVDIIPQTQRGEARKGKEAREAGLAQSCQPGVYVLEDGVEARLTWNVERPHFVSLHLVKRDDVQLMVDTGLEAYRFPISWSRLIPNGRGPVNPKGLQYYNNLINELFSNGYCPFQL
ncbi:hypothetical protein CMV_014936 [Castanea mollissima]|uniref:Uncharacterized protein n=1 Tax=Castanea mollissima TaxID=60419 RepID=A0A8J4VTX6_9ROSI|nr:hypothetical protein CMV_014936 [Castanea mollissima]